MIKCISALILVCAGTLSISAQDFRQDITALQKEFENMTSIHVVMDIKAFGTVNDARPYFQTHVDIRKQDNRYCYLYGELEMLMNDNYLIVVNKSERQISMTKRDVKSEAAIAKSMHFNLDSMITTIGTVQYKGEVNGVRQYSVPATKRLPETDLFIEVQTKSLRKIEYHYPDGQFVIIEFKIFDKQPVFTDNTFSETNYVILTKGKAAPAAGFKNFTIASP